MSLEVNRPPAPSPWKRLLWQAVTGVALGLLLLGILIIFLESRSNQNSQIPQSSLKLNEPAPEFVVRTLDGQTLKLSELRGQPVWLNFWAEWCAPCRAEMPELARVGEEAKAQGVRLLAIDVGDKPDRVQSYLKRSGLESLPVALDESGQVSIDYKVEGFPEHMFIDSEGILRRVEEQRLSAEDMREALQVLE